MECENNKEVKNHINEDTTRENDLVLKLEETEEIIESDDTKRSECESGSDVSQQPQPNEEMWVVRRQLCRGCHSDGAFWSLETTTEGVAYGDLLQTYFNIQLCRVSRDEHALSAICALCAARLREARAFSAQARAAEEHFTSLYKQNRVRALVNAVVIKEVDAPEIVNKVDDLEISDDDDVPDTANSDVDRTNICPEAGIEPATSCVAGGPSPTAPQRSSDDDDHKPIISYVSLDDSEISDDVVPDTVNSDVDSPEVSEAFRIERTFEWAPKLNKNKDIQVRCYKPASKKSPAKKLVPYEDTQKILVEGDPQSSKEILTKARCDKPAPNKFIFKLSPSDYQRIGKSFKCTRCNKIFCYRSGIQNHVKNVHLESMSCPHCDKTFKKISDLNRHKKNYHSSNLSPSDIERVGKLFKCTRCGKQNKSYAEVRYHMMYAHLKLPRYTCSHCDKTFHSLTLFTRHKLEEHSIDDRIKCSACDWFSYDSISRLTNHMNVFHMLGKKLSCPDCDYVCFSQQQIRKHAVRHSTVKKYHCNYCKKSFLRKNNLCQHVKIHTGDKRKVCNVCGQAFVQRASLKYHMAKHHPEVH